MCINYWQLESVIGGTMAMSSRFAGMKCPMCSFEAATVRIVLSHLRIVNFHDPCFNVTCGVDGC